MNKFLLLSLFITQVSLASDTKTVYSSTELYESPSLMSAKKGVFRAFAKVEVLEITNEYWCKVQTESLITGFILRKFLIKPEDEKEFSYLNPDIFYGSLKGRILDPELKLYVNVAGLRARTEPTKNAKVLTMLKMNEPCSPSFLPYDIEEWVLAGYDFNNRNGESLPFYVQRKFLGIQIDINLALASYSESTSFTEEEQQRDVERLLEMSHFESDSIRKIVLMKFIAYSETQNPSKNLEALRAEILGMDKCVDHNLVNWDEYFETIHQLVFSCYWKKVKLEFSKEESLKIAGLEYQVISQFPEDYSECSNGFEKGYYLEGVKLIDEGDPDDETFLVWKMDLTNKNCFLKIADFEINSMTNETEFINNVGSFFFIDGRGDEHSYFLGESGRVITFKNGKPYDYEYQSQC
jgi:hypothetical protein